MQLLEITKKAYKKLKASVYFDKTQLSLRNKIVEYECSDDNHDSIDEKLENITYMLETSDEITWRDYSENLLNSIQALTLPKKIVEREDKSLIINNDRNDIIIDTPQYFFDMDVEGQIIGVLWLLLIGIEYDQNFYDHSYGNRLKKSLIEDKIDFSPYLFQPYYEQYESWRDTGLKLAQEYLKKNKDIIIITLDFKNFYHSVDFSDQIFSSFYTQYSNKYGDSLCIKRINEFVYNVIKTYSSLFRQFNDRNILPIGFYPSNILSNWYLDKFDFEIINRWNPLYYGRYVDDIIIVEKIEKNSKIHKMVQNIESKKVEIVDYFLCNCRHLQDNQICDLSLFSKRLMDEGPEEQENIEYFIDPKLFRDVDENIKPEIILQNAKIKIFYFNSKGSDALITRFRNEITKNKSEFRFLPEDGTVFVDDDYSEIYSLKYSDTINKFRAVDGASIDKFSLSKFLGKYLRIGSIIRDKKESKFINDIIKIFDNKTVIENYLVWEKVLFYLAIHESFDKYREFVINIYGAIQGIKFDKEKDKGKRIKYPDESLFKFLFSAITKSLSHVWGPEAKKCIYELSKAISNKYLRYNKVKKLRLFYLRTRMCDKYLMPILIDALIDGDYGINFNDESAYNLSDLSVFLTNSENLDLESTHYKYYPYIITPLDLSMGIILKNIRRKIEIDNNRLILKKINNKHFELNYAFGNEKDSLEFSDYEILDNIECREFIVHPNKENDKIHTYVLNIGTLKMKKPRIAIANATLYDDDFTGILIDSPNRSFKRYNRLSTIVNSAIKSNANILVLPEAYVPFEWLPLLYRVSTKSNMLIITGVEHIKSDEAVYNLTATILPYINKDRVYTYVNFHTKVYYSPEEEREIRGYGLEAQKGSSYDLSSWNDIWFTTYCCYELASITDRCRFMSYLDLFVAVEWNKDTNYYSNIIESLSRDLHCYCVQVNTSNFGDSRITQPSKTDIKDIVKTKGGINDTVLIGEIDIEKLRKFQLKKYELQKEDKLFKPIPPQFNTGIVKKKIKGTLFSELHDN